MSAPSLNDPFAGPATLEGVPSAFTAARDGIDAVLRDRGLRTTTPADTALALMRGAWATATLEGTECEIDEMSAGGGDELARAAVRLSAELLGLVPVWKRTPVQVLARLHALAASGQVPEEYLGRPSNAEGVARLQDMARMLAQPTKAPALVVAALVHAEVADAAAFASHNGVVARAAERLVWVSRGVDPASVCVPEAGHLMDAPAYFAALANYSSSPTGVHSWLLYSAEAATRSVEASPLVSR